MLNTLITVVVLLGGSVSDAEFVTKITTGVNALHEQNPTVQLIGSGTAEILDSHRESKVKCGRANPNPKPGECTGLYPVYPKPKPLAELVKAEAKAKAKADAKLTVWVAWRDCDGIINVAFNAPAGKREISAPDEVANKSGDWTGMRIYFISGTATPGEKDTMFVKDIESSFTWYHLGAGSATDLPQRLKALTDLNVIRDIKVK